MHKTCQRKKTAHLPRLPRPPRSTGEPPKRKLYSSRSKTALQSNRPPRGRTRENTTRVNKRRGGTQFPCVWRVVPTKATYCRRTHRECRAAGHPKARFVVAGQREEASSRRPRRVCAPLHRARGPASRTAVHPCSRVAGGGRCYRLPPPVAPPLRLLRSTPCLCTVAIGGARVLAAAAAAAVVRSRKWQRRPEERHACYRRARFLTAETLCRAAGCTACGEEGERTTTARGLPRPPLDDVAARLSATPGRDVVTTAAASGPDWGHRPAVRFSRALDRCSRLSFALSRNRDAARVARNPRSRNVS